MSVLSDDWLFALHPDFDENNCYVRFLATSILSLSTYGADANSFDGSFSVMFMGQCILRTDILHFQISMNNGVGSGFV